MLKKENEFESLSIGLASPERIRFWSYGDVEKPETINYRTFKAERKGLFCEKIFGPVKDWECACGKYRRIRYRGIVCERCGVEVTSSKVRRERMGHIELVCPVTHIWFLKGIPGYLSFVLNMTTRQLEEIIYYDIYIITEIDKSLEDQYTLHQTISIAEYNEIKEKYGKKIQADIGGSAIKNLLQNLNIPKEIKSIRAQLINESEAKKIKLTKRLRILESLNKSSNKPEWMVLEAIPVMPPDLRPMVQLEGGRFAASDLNDLYRRVVNRNNRLKRLMDIGAPDMIIRNEKRMLQESVDVLISNGKRGKSVVGSNGRPLKSLGNIIEGKQGRFRQNLLGKRVDYSARSVIVVGPNLKFHQCGLPKEMALELFKPFVIRKLVEKGIVANVKNAKRSIEAKEVRVWAVLEEIIKGQSVLLNRAPTLHRLGIQAFEPILVEGSAIQIHPLTCTAFNADFDGDQMAVHLPLSIEAQAEARLLVMSNNNILSPSSGNAIITPTQDMVLGCYFLTIIDDRKTAVGTNKYFADIDEARRAFDAEVIQVQSEIIVRVDNKRVRTSMGRVIFNHAIREIFSQNNIKYEKWVNEVVSKKVLANLIYDWYVEYGNVVTSLLANKLKDIGFHYATYSGISISIDDLTIPEDKNDIIENTVKQVEKLEELEKKKKISLEQKKLQSNDLWREATQRVSDALEKTMGRFNNVHIMAHSGARGNIDQVRQLAGMRGLMSDSQGRTVEIPIKSNFKEGLSLTEYFISCYGARKGLVDTALRTADSGYLTRRLVDVAQDVKITIEDCGTSEGVYIESLKEGIKTLVPLSEMIEGLTSLEDIKDGKRTLVKNDEMISREMAKAIEALGIEKVKVRSVFMCKAEKGICKKCYGIDLATTKPVNIGEAVGIIAAQSIGEPGTQLTMRTFHTGGVDLRKAAKIEVLSKQSGKVEISDELILNKYRGESEASWVVIEEGNISVKGESRTESHLLPKGSVLRCKDNQKIEKDSLLFEYDPNLEFMSAQTDGVVKLIEEENQQTNEVFVYNPKAIKKITATTTLANKCEINKKVPFEVLKQANQIGPCLLLEINNSDSNKQKELLVAHGQSYFYTMSDTLLVQEDDKVKKNDILIKTNKQAADASKTLDIVQGLPKVEEIFEARKPKVPAVLAGCSGCVDVFQNPDETKSIIIVDSDGDYIETKVDKTKGINVFSGQMVEKGQKLTDGTINPFDLLEKKGIVETQRFLSEEVQRVYRSQGVSIKSKHIEVIVRQMTKKIVITDMGDSTFLLNEVLERKVFEEENKKIRKKGLKEAQGDRMLLGITRASLTTESFVSAASFQQTGNVLTKAAIESQEDPMYGLKENVIIGKKIPAGTGVKDIDDFSILINEEKVNEFYAIAAVNDNVKDEQSVNSK